jgi:hypothetical protein
MNRRAPSITIGPVAVSFSATGMATRTNSQAASVLQIAIFSLAAMSAALVIGRVAMKGVTPYPSLPPGFALRTVAAANTAMNGGVSSTPSRMTKTSAGASPAANSSASSNGSRMPTSAGSERPCCRHSNHA